MGAVESKLEGVGAVAIGRNEGERLRRCLSSLAGRVAPLVYVDSGSSDGSPELARSFGAVVVDLDLSRPFTAARARNEGVAALRAAAPGTELVQLVDGDCEVVPGWLEAAVAALRAEPRLAAVCGRRRERRPEASIYNAICDVEWDTPAGEARATGGDAMFRTAALAEVGGFRDDLIAGEEPELCYRLRQRGWTIRRLPLEMTLHDAAMTRFGQWWQRSVRAGHAYAESAHLHGAEPPEQFRRREHRRIWLWGALLPGVAVGAALPTLGTSLLLLGGYPLSGVRAYRDARARGREPGEAALWGAFCVLGKLPQLQGAARFHWNRLRGRRSGLIEYKGQAR